MKYLTLIILLALAPLSWGDRPPLVKEFVDDFSGLTRLQTDLNCEGGFCSQLYTDGENAIGYFGYESKQDLGILQRLKIKIAGQERFFTISGTPADGFAEKYDLQRELESNEKARFVGEVSATYKAGLHRYLIQLKLPDELIEKMRGALGRQIQVRAEGKRYTMDIDEKISTDGQWAQFFSALDSQ